MTVATNDETNMMIAHRRGVIIHRTIKLEFLMDGIVKGHFCHGDKTKADEIQKKFIQEKTFGFKKNKLLDALQGMHIQESIVDLIKEDLQFVNDIRNKAAHFDWALVTGDEIYLKPDSSEPLLDIADDKLFEFSIGEEKTRQFMQACSRLQNSLSAIFLKHFSPFPDTLFAKEIEE